MARTQSTRPRWSAAGTTELNAAADPKYYLCEMVINSSKLPTLNPGDVHVWQIPLAGDPTPHIAVLSPAELTRLERHRGVRRDRFAISHGATRQVLGGYLGCPPRDVPLACEYGQPPAVPTLQLSLSHADQLAVLAIAPAPVGIDVESNAHADDEDLEHLADATLAPSELRAFAATAPEQRPAMWLRSWVRKEAAMKARGHGLGDQALCELDVSGPRLRELELVDLHVGPDHVAALASTQPIARVHIEEWVDGSS